jgi:hypothetical protein
VAAIQATKKWRGWTNLPFNPQLHYKTLEHLQVYP